MDDQEDPKTLEEGSSGSKLVQSLKPCGQNPAQDSALSEFSKTCNGSVLGNNRQAYVNSIVVETRNETRTAFGGENCLLGFENNMESLKGEGFTEEDEMKREFLVKCNKGPKDCDGSHMEGHLAVIENDGVEDGMNMADEVAEETDDTTQMCRSDSARKVDGISLFVEVFGSLDDIYQAEDLRFNNEAALKDGDSRENTLCERDGTLSPHDCGGVEQSPDFILDVLNTGTTEEANELDDAVDEGVGNQECNFIVGDVVWIKTKTNLWWPGVVSDPSNATKDAGCNKKGCLLVKYFGNANFIWCFPSQLKHFHQCFDEMVQQNNSRSFCGAVERAVNEIGQHVKEEMTCSCFSRESSAEASVQTENGKSESKQKIAFYHSLGHCQLPMHQLRPTDAKESAQSGSTLKEYGNHAEVLRGHSSLLEECGTGVDERHPISSTMASKLTEEKENISGGVEILAGSNMNSSVISPGARDGSVLSGQTGGATTDGRSDKGIQLRERKKSKYLSYPYIDPSKDTPTSAPKETEDPEKVSNEGTESNSMNKLKKRKVSNPGTESNSKNRLKKRAGKSSCKLNLVCKPEDLNSSSAEMLSDLRRTALNCSYYQERKCSASIRRFFASFRRFAFLNHEIAADKDVGDNLKSSQTDNCSRNLPEAQHQKKGTNRDSEDAGENPSSSGKPKKRRRRKKEAVTSASAVFVRTMTDAVNGSMENQSKQLGTGTTQSDSRKTAVVSGIRDIEPTTQLPDVNANGTNSSLEGLQVPGNTASEGKRVRKKRKLKESPIGNGLGSNLNGRCVKFVQLLKDVQKVGPNVQLLKDVQKVGPNVQTASPSLFTSNLERNNMVSESEVASEVSVRQAEASGNHVESSSLVQDLQQTQTLGTAANPEKKKRRWRKKILNFENIDGNSSIPDLNGNVGESGPGVTNATDMNSVPNNDKPQRRRRRRKSDAAVPDKGLNKVELSGAIILSFVPGVSLPSVESLLTTFVGYGALIESETRYVDDSTAQVIFLQGSDALRALRSLQENNPFGPSLVNCRLVYLSAPQNSSIPDLNGNIAEPGSVGNTVADTNSIPLPDANSVPNKDKPRQRRRRKKAQNNEELLGAILLDFSSGVSLPSVESLLTAFAGHGIIKESETRYINGSSAQVVFTQTSDALQAFRSLQERNPFGSALAGCRFIYLSAPSAPKPTKNLQMPRQPCLPMNGVKTPAMPSALNPTNADPPNLLTIKQNLEMMKSMLEKAGNSLSAQMRAKLENEIQGLMQKVNSTVGSSSS